MGVDSDGRHVHIDGGDGHRGVAVVGRPGTGKSVLVRSLFAWNSQERVSPSGNPRWPGSRNALVAIESKGEGDRYVQWADTIGDRTLLVDFTDQATYGIDLFDLPGATVAERAAFITNAMEYAYGDNAIQYQSKDTLKGVFTVAMLVTDGMAARAGLSPGESFMSYANTLLGNRGDDLGVALAQQLKAAAKEAEFEAQAIANQRALPAGDGWEPDTSGGEGRAAVTELGKAVEAMSQLYGDGVTRSARDKLIGAPRTKVSLLMGAEFWWSPSRPKVTWRQVLEGHKSIVVNTGSSRGRRVDADLNGHLSSLLMYSLRSSIETYCSGWQEQGRSVTLFSDELSLIAGKSPEVVTWLRDKGRSFGVRLIFATQRAEQLDQYPQVKDAFLSFETQFWYAQSVASVAANGADTLKKLRGENWEPSDIAQLPEFTAILMSVVKNSAQPTVTVRMVDWEADTAGFTSTQGWA